MINEELAIFFKKSNDELEQIIEDTDDLSQRRFDDWKRRVVLKLSGTYKIKLNRLEIFTYIYDDGLYVSTHEFNVVQTITYFTNQKLDFFKDKRVMFHLEPIKDELKVKEHIKVFNLESLYAEHKDIVSELLQKRVIYSDSYIDELFKQYEGTLFKNREDLLRLITCGYVTDEEIGKRPLSKLIKDISQELGLI